jgi:sulfatase modifying factor 1
LKATNLRPLVGCFVVLAFIGTSARAVTIATVPVGISGNAPDPATGSLFGAVPYNYRIGTYDVTNAQYAEFLNAKAALSDPYGLWVDASSLPEGAIFRSASAPYSYTVKSGFANKPVIFVSWYEAVRFVNWLTNGQGNGDTESGTYLITNGGYKSGTAIVPDATQRMTWANTNSFHWLLPSENEWYKAAYYNALSGTYYAYPFRSNSQPAALAPAGNPNSGNFEGGDFQHVTFPAYNYDGSGSYLTDVGAYPNSVSPFGTFDMGGDVTQWNDTAIGSHLQYGTRGGWYSNFSAASGASTRGMLTAAPGYNFVGFRVASVGSVPEPSTALLLALAAVLAAIIRCRRRSPV